jgi:triosephosphate isomerase
MNHTRASTKEFVNTLDDFMKKESIDSTNVLIFPPASALDKFELNSDITIGSQNAYFKIRGSFTGEIGKEQLDEFDIKTTLIGHSERRELFKEENSLILEKFKFYKDLGFEIVFCIGEPLEVKNRGIDETIKYLFNQLENIDLEYENLIIAYEPIWAIGTGVTASTDDISLVHKALKEKIDRPILYGGSVKICNTQEILEVDGVDGLLIGTASWNVEDFSKIVYIAEKLNSLGESIKC